MGKKTDKFTAELTTQGDNCQDLLGQLVKINERMLKNNKDWDSARRAGNIQLILDEIEPARLQIWNQGKPKCVELRTALNQLDDAVSAFNTYITKKAKSKNPFKSKKSVPAAQDTIRVYKEFLQIAEEALNEMRANFQ